MCLLVCLFFSVGNQPRPHTTTELCHSPNFVYVQLQGFSLTFSPDDQHFSFLGNMKNN